MVFTTRDLVFELFVGKEKVEKFHKKGTDEGLLLRTPCSLHHPQFPGTKNPVSRAVEEGSKRPNPELFLSLQNNRAATLA